MMAELKHPTEHPPVHIQLTKEQKKAIVDYVAKTGMNAGGGRRADDVCYWLR